MKVVLRHVEVHQDNMVGWTVPTSQEVDLPGCLVSGQTGEPFIVGVSNVNVPDDWDKPYTVARVWYISKMADANALDKDEIDALYTAVKQHGHNPTDMNDIAQIVQEVAMSSKDGFVAFSERYAIARAILDAGFNRNVGETVFVRKMRLARMLKAQGKPNGVGFTNAELAAEVDLSEELLNELL